MLSDAANSLLGQTKHQNKAQNLRQLYGQWRAPDNALPSSIYHKHIFYITYAECVVCCKRVKIVMWRYFILSSIFCYLLYVQQQYNNRRQQ